MIIYLSVAICLIGALIYGFAKGDVKALGLHMFWVGLLVSLVNCPGTPVHFLGK